MTETVNVLLPVLPTESVTVSLIVYWPLAEHVIEIVLELEDPLHPVGRNQVYDVYTPLPPVTCAVQVNGLPAVAVVQVSVLRSVPKTVRVSPFAPQALVNPLLLPSPV